MSDFGVSPQVREEACEKAEATSSRRHLRDEYSKARYMERLGVVFDAMAPVIAGAAYKEAKARIEHLGSEYNPNWTPEENRAYGIGLKAALNALEGNPQDQVADNRAAALAAIDKEGEQDAPENR